MYIFRWVIFLLVRVCHNYWVIFVLHENKKNAERSLERLLNYIFGWLANTSVYSAFITPEIWPEAHPQAAKPNRTEPEVPNLVWSHISNPIVVATVRTQCCYGCAFVAERHRSVPTVDWRSYLETASAYNDCLLYSRSLLLRGKKRVDSSRCHTRLVAQCALGFSRGDCISTLFAWSTNTTVV